MSMSWVSRKCRLAELLHSQGDEDADGATLDRLLHGQNVIGKTSKTTEIDLLRFQNKDLRVLGALDAGQFGSIDVVHCRLDGRVYVRKTLQKQLALRASQQCFPQWERDILLLARKDNTSCAPHLLCSFQSLTALNMIMTYEEGGNLWNVLESSPLDSRIAESDLRWWMPQMVSAVAWCHSKGFAHRDIKPHNFIITLTAHVKLIDFGSVAPFEHSEDDTPGGSRKIPQKYCSVPCGTCDYVSPEILKAHEEALVALELDEPTRSSHQSLLCYGVETDWWSFGAMVYEMAFGIAPFFAKEVRHTYFKIMDHKSCLRFRPTNLISSTLQDLLSKLLTDAEFRLGSDSDDDVMRHPFFSDVDWDKLYITSKPSSLHTPEFEYLQDEGQDEQNSHFQDVSNQSFSFSGFFQPSSAPDTSSRVSHMLKSKSYTNDATTSREMTSSFIGFSWGPPLNAFPAHFQPSPPLPKPSTHDRTPQPNVLGVLPPLGARLTPGSDSLRSLHFLPPNNFVTPMRPSTHTFADARRLTPYQTLPRSSTRPPGTSTVRKRAVSDKEAMKQLADCVGMSARKKVLDSGRKPRILAGDFFANQSGGISFPDRLKRSAPQPDFPSFTISLSGSLAKGRNDGATSQPLLSISHTDDDGYSSAAVSSSDDSEGYPPSPTPSGRPGSTLSRRSTTPTLTGRLPTLSSLRSRSRSNTTTSSLLLPKTPTAAFLPEPPPPPPPSTQPSEERGQEEIDPHDVRQSPSPDWSSILLEMEHRHKWLLGEIQQLEDRVGQSFSPIRPD